MKKRDRIKRSRNAGKASAGVPRGESSRDNGRNRKMNPEIVRIMQERGVSKQRAHVILARLNLLRSVHNG